MNDNIPKPTRTERDLLGERLIPAGSLAGIHTLRAMENFILSGRPVHRALVHAYGAVKLACAMTNRDLGIWDEATASAIEQACREMLSGDLDRHITVDALQGGAGTSTNMAVNEVLANRALDLCGEFAMSEKCPIVRAWRDAKIMTIFAGTNEIMKNIAAKFMGL